MDIKEKFIAFFGLDDYDELKTETFGDFFRRVRLSREMTTSELSVKSGISQSYISQLENNVRLPSDKIIKKISYGLISKDNVGSDYDRLLFINHNEEKNYKILVSKFTNVRNYMQVKDIPAILDTNDDDELMIINKEEKEFLQLFRKFSEPEKKNLLTYIHFLLIEDRK